VWAPAAAIRIVRRLNWPARILLLVMTAALFSVAMVEATGQPGFCRSCHIMGPYYDSWKHSAHAEVNCLECHLQPGFTGLIKGKINGLAQAVDCAVGRVGTKPNATIADASCLRSQCHDTQKLAGETLDCSGVRFTHEKHIDQVVDGIRITCGTCHNHFEGDEHFSVDRNACFACHFLGGSARAGRPVRANGGPPSRTSAMGTPCQGCHQVPQQVIRRGFVKIDHSEFISYRASCEESCHKREVLQTSRVEETACLDCHSFRKPADANSMELHANHTNGEKVECFACHGHVPHGQTGVESVTAMMDCQSCHSDTHQAQRSIYGTQHPMGPPTPTSPLGNPRQPNGTDRVLGPMFLTHVECTGCHIERTAKSPGTLDSFGTVARATPTACDKCHEAGTGQKYVPFWQERIKALYAQVEKRVEEAEVLALAQKDGAEAQQFDQRVRQARSILDSIRYDGSWGVHNFKYTEALLLEADKMVSPGRQ
jgi:nitrate/TMAO reductase-like tetraheme cytochrome c subunit